MSDVKRAARRGGRGEVAGAQASEFSPRSLCNPHSTRAHVINVAAYEFLPDKFLRQFFYRFFLGSHGGSVPAISNILTGRMNDLLLARATFAAAVKRWPGAKLTLRNGAAG